MQNCQGNCPHEFFFGGLRAAQGNGGVFRTRGFRWHRRQWVKWNDLWAFLQCVLHVSIRSYHGMLEIIRECPVLTQDVIERLTGIHDAQFWPFLVIQSCSRKIF